MLSLPEVLGALLHTLHLEHWQLYESHVLKCTIKKDPQTKTCTHAMYLAMLNDLETLWTLIAPPLDSNKTALYGHHYQSNHRTINKYFTNHIAKQIEHINKSLGEHFKKEFKNHQIEHDFEGCYAWLTQELMRNTLKIAL